MKRLVSLLLVIVILLSSLLLVSCGFMDVLDFILNGGHEHSWDNWIFDYSDTDVRVVCSCGDVIATHPISEGLEIEDGVLLGVGTCTDETVIVPDGVTVVGAEAFMNNSTISTIFLPSTVTFIGYSAFENCSALQMINIPEGVLTVEDNAFKGCTKLYGILLPESLAYLGDECFADCPLYITLYYRGNEDGWNKVEKDDEWDKNTEHDDPEYKNWGKNCIHRWGEWITVLEEDCYNYGESVRVCAKCYKLERRQHMPQHYKGDPNKEPEIYIEPTCISPGYQKEKCLCGYRYFTYSRISPLEHNIETTIEDDIVTVFCYDCDKVVLTCDYVEGSKGLNISNGIVMGLGDCKDTNIVIPSFYEGYPVTEISWSAFSQNDKINSVVIPDSVMIINNDAFIDNINLETVVLGKNVSYIGERAFSNCSKLHSINLPEGLKTLEDFCFSGCKSLTSIEIPDSLTNLGEYAFEYYNLNCNIYRNGKYLGNSNNPYLMFVGLLSEDVTYLELHNNTKLLLRSSAEDPFRAAKNLKSISISESNEYFQTIDGVLYTKDGKTILRYPPEKEGTKFVVPDGVVELARESFAESKYLKEIVLPESVHILGDRAFRTMYELTTVNIPKGVKKLPTYLFQNSTALKTLTIPEGVEIIEDGVFDMCFALESLYLPQSIKIIAPDIFSQIHNYLTINYAGTQKQWYEISRSNMWTGDLENYSLTFTDGSFNVGHFHEFGEWIMVKEPEYIETEDYISIDPGTLERKCECGEVEQISVPYYRGVELTLSENGDYFIATVTGTTLNNDVYVPGYYYNLSADDGNYYVDVKELVIPETVTTIGGYVFNNCSFERVTIADSVAHIGDWAFRYCDNLKSVKMPESLITIGEDAFANCTSLKSISIPDSVTTIGGGAFFKCTSLTSLDIPESVTEIGGWAFYDCTALKSITINGPITSIEMAMFEGCTSLTSVTLPGTITYIDGQSFWDCKSLKTINFGGTVEQWQSITKANGWNMNTGNYTVYCTDGQISK